MMMRTPKQITKKQESNRQRALCSSQLSSILHPSPMAPVSVRLANSNINRDSLSNRAGGMNSVGSARLAGNEHDSNTPKDLIIDSRNANANDTFIVMFSDWLKITERESDPDSFAKLKEDLCKLVGKYTLETRKE